MSVAHFERYVQPFVKVVPCGQLLLIEPGSLDRWVSEHARFAGLARVTLHEARHTYASFLMAAGYNLKQIQEYLGHADLVTTGRYIKNLPVPRGTTAREKLEAYLAAEIGHLEP